MNFKIQIRNLKTLSRSSMIRTWEKYFVPNNIYLGILGDCNLKTIKNLTKEIFGLKTGKRSIYFKTGMVFFNHSCFLPSNLFVLNSYL